MSTLFHVVFAWKCTSTHHKLALDALRHLRHPDAEAWRNLFLQQADRYLAGSKAPDDVFKDFRNHVLHVRENYWGGAISACKQAYNNTLEALRRRNWPDACFAAGVMSHYYTDPLMPFHTGQSEEEAIVHRAAEWSVTKSYEALRKRIEDELGYPQFEAPNGPEWLANMLRDGASQANRHYEVLIDHYNLAVGVKNPPAGLDVESQTRFATMLAKATIGLSRILDRLFLEAGEQAPKVNVTLAEVFAKLTIPIGWITKKLQDSKDRTIVESMYREFQQTGKVIQTLPEDDKMVRRLHASEVLGVPLERLDAQRPREIGRSHGEPAPEEPLPAPANDSPTPIPIPTPSPFIMPAFVPAEPGSLPSPTLAKTESLSARPARPTKAKPARGPRFHLTPEMPVVDAPSIGPRMARKLEPLGIATVADLLAASPKDVADRLATRGVVEQTIVDWQAQAKLVCDVLGLRGHDAQILVGVGVRTSEQLGGAEVTSLGEKVAQFVQTSEGQRILRSSKPPDAEEIAGWIRSAGASPARRVA